MMRVEVGRPLAALLVSALLFACGGGRGGMVTTPAPDPAPNADGGRAVVATPASIARARADSARLAWTRADAEFMTHMVGHHAQAIVMARLAPGRAESAAVLRLAERIINAQRDEIVTMQQWLADRQQPVPDPGVPMTHGTATGHEAHGGAHAAHGASSSATALPAMPGMLTPAQLSELEQARGRAFDRLFLTYMIQHHQGAVAMVEKLFGTYGAGQDEAVFKFASDVQVDQRTEIARMQRMLLTVDFEKVEP